MWVGVEEKGVGDMMEVEDATASKVEKQEQQQQKEGEEEGEEEDDKPFIAWRHALEYLATRGIIVDLEEAKVKRNIGTPYIPLKDRAVGQTYEEAVATLSGKKKELFEQAQAKREAAEKRGGDQFFFQKMRGIVANEKEKEEEGTKVPELVGKE